MYYNEGYVYLTYTFVCECIDVVYRLIHFENEMKFFLLPTLILKKKILSIFIQIVKQSQI